MISDTNFYSTCICKSCRLTCLCQLCQWSLKNCGRIFSAATIQPIAFQSWSPFSIWRISFPWNLAKETCFCFWLSKHWAYHAENTSWCWIANSKNHQPGPERQKECVWVCWSGGLDHVKDWNPPFLESVFKFIYQITTLAPHLQVLAQFRHAHTPW